MKDILSLKTIFVTGGSGFIGSNLIRELIKHDCKINLILKKSSNIWRIKDVVNKVIIHHANLLDKNKLRKLIEKVKPDYIIHLATYSDYRSQENVEEMIDANIKGTLNLLLASKDIRYKLFINTGSSSEYGIKNNPMKETDSLEPISFYAATKASTTFLCNVFSKIYKKPILTLRPFSVFGPYEDKARFIPTIIRSVINNMSIKITSGNQRRDFIFIKDVINIYIKSLQSKKDLSGQILNMGTGTEYANDEVVKYLFKVAGKKVKIEKGKFPKRLWDTSHWVADISKTKKILNWKPKFNLKKGLRETYFWNLSLSDK